MLGPAKRWWRSVHRNDDIVYLGLAVLVVACGVYAAWEWLA